MEKDSQLRILCLYQILLRYSDMDHPLSTRELIERMEEEYKIRMHRTTVPKYIELLNESGIEVMKLRSREKKYYLGDRLFELPELKLLVDAVQSSKFISERKSSDLISRLASLTSKANAEKLKRNLYVVSRVKPDNEKCYYIVDAINEAINRSKRVSFLYTDYNVKKERILKNNGRPYIISPYILIWDSDFYYVLGFSHDDRGQVKTFRVDRIYRQPEILKEDAAPVPESLDLEKYTQEVFRMYDTGEPREVSLLCENSLMKHLIDHFGLDVKTEITDESHFRAKVRVCASPTFYRWVFGWGGKMRIEKPDDVKKEYRQMIETVRK